MAHRVALLGLLAVLVVVAAPRPVNALAVPGLASEAAFASFEQAATAAGAVGFFTDDTGALVVDVPASVGAAFALPSTSALSVAVRVTSSQLDASTIRKVKDRLAGMWDVYRGTGYGAYFDAKSGLVRVIGNLSTQQIQDYMGDLAFAVDYQTAPISRLTRHSDYPAFWGGSETVHTGGTDYDCSTGFAVKDSAGTRSLATAGHCFFTIGTQVKSPGSGQVQGTVTRRAIFPHDDVELIGGKTYGPQIYVAQNSNSTNTSKLVNGATDPVVGRAIYCHSGAATYVECGQTVNDLDADFCDPVYGCTFHTIEYDGGGLSQCGDSGAPFYLDGTDVGIRGMVIGGDRNCFGQGGDHNWAMKWSKISSVLGLSIVTN